MSFVWLVFVILRAKPEISLCLMCEWDTSLSCESSVWQDCFCGLPRLALGKSCNDGVTWFATLASFVCNDNPPPVSPSAREGESVKLRSAREGDFWKSPRAREGDLAKSAFAMNGESKASPSPCGRDLGWGLLCESNLLLEFLSDWQMGGGESCLNCLNLTPNLH